MDWARAPIRTLRAAASLPDLSPLLCESDMMTAPTNPSTPYLAESNVDDLGRMVVALLSEVWIMRDRMHVLEKLLEERAGLGVDDIENYRHSPASIEQLDALRKRLVDNVVGAPLLAQQRGVDDILAHSKVVPAAS